MEKELWTPSMPLPDGSKVSKFGKGKYLWPFSLALPTEVQVQDQKVIKKFPLPATFSERASAGYLDYKLIVTVKRGTFRVNQMCESSFQPCLHLLRNMQSAHKLCVCPFNSTRATVPHAPEGVQGRPPSYWSRRSPSRKYITTCLLLSDR
jgi:hypothetical protein